MLHGNFEDFHKKFYYDSPDDLERKRARLFPAFDKKKIIEEDVTSNIFLGCLVGIKEFWEIFFQEINIKLKSNSKIHAYTQLNFENKNSDHKEDVPDGLLVITEGKHDPIVSWVALLEFKTAKPLEKEQVNRYATIAKNKNFDAIITVSNDLVSTPLHNPFGFRNSNTFSYFHFSWIRIQTLLNYVLQQGINDNDQIYLANQFYLYLDDHKDVRTFDEMNKDWESQSRYIRNNSISKTKDKSILESIASDWLQEEQDLGLKLKSQTRRELNVKLQKEEQKNINMRMNSIIEKIYNEKILQSIYVFEPDKSTKSPFSVSKKRNLEILNTIYFEKRQQVITLEIDIDISSIPYKTLSKQIEFFVKQFLNQKPAKMDAINLKVYITGHTNPISIKTLANYNNDIKFNKILNGFENCNSKNNIRKFELEFSADLGNIFFNRKKFISALEENFSIFFIQIVKPFSI